MAGSEDSMFAKRLFEMMNFICIYVVERGVCGSSIVYSIIMLIYIAQLYDSILNCATFIYVTRSTQNHSEFFKYLVNIERNSSMFL